MRAQADSGRDWAIGRPSRITPAESRRQERRQGAVFRWHERRSGFDNRRPPRLNGPAPILAWPREVAAAMRDSPGLLLGVLLLFNLYNLADYALTIIALAEGHRELNPVMRRLIAFDPLLAGIFKITTGLMVTAVIWHYRRFRLMLQLALFCFALYLMILTYHFCGVFFAAGMP